MTGYNATERKYEWIARLLILMQCQRNVGQSLVTFGFKLEVIKQILSRKAIYAEHFTMFFYSPLTYYFPRRVLAIGN